MKNIFLSLGLSIREFYIPRDIEDCLFELERILPDNVIQEIKESPEQDMVLYHSNLGVQIRNDWRLSENSRLAVYFNSLGIIHPDDMTSIILTSFHRYLNGKDIELGE